MYLDVNTTEETSGNKHENSFASLTAQFIRELLSFLEYIFLGVWVGRKP
ncbi:MAG: hypothetical protein NC122_06825 [Faecalibacterium sp.]|nr:hypothetical protein [Ruminococcus sp.]MCM1392391.1 hypothetical protein [Ruminococcus sp.]MCM1485903.1 hypothetical protein [Faecalibacterium sp.]